MSSAKAAEAERPDPTSAAPPEAAVNYAARLTDAEHRVEIDLYALPTTLEELDHRLSQVRAMPHTEEERTRILGRLAAESRSFAATADWQTRFGTLSVCETGEPIGIPITTENYGLLYAAFQSCPEAQTRAVAPVIAAETPCAECAPSEPAETPAPLSNEEGVEAVPDLTQVNGGEQIFERGEVPPALAAYLRVLDTQISEALAHAVVLHQFALRKPQTRGKNLTELLSKYATRSPGSLRDTLADLTEEWATQDGSVPVSLPRIVDPTSSREAAAAQSGVIDNTPAAETDGTVTISTAQPLAALETVTAGELPLEEGDPENNLIYRLFPDLEVEAAR